MEFYNRIAKYRSFFIDSLGYWSLAFGPLVAKFAWWPGHLA